MSEPAVITGQSRIFILEDHPFLRMGLKQFLEMEPDMEICGDFDRARGAVDAVKAASPDLILIDISLPDGSGLELIKDLRAAGYTRSILVLTMHDEAIYAERALRAGANGYAVKTMSSEHVLEAIRKVLAGDVFVPQSTTSRLLKRIGGNRGDETASPAIESLTDRETEIFELLGAGMTTHQIAERLCISPKTVDAHRANIKKKMGITDMNELIRFAVLQFGGVRG